jgi:hypothetical protein
MRRLDPQHRRDLRADREWRIEVTDEFANPIYVIHINAENK